MINPGSMPSIRVFLDANKKLSVLIKLNHILISFNDFSISAYIVKYNLGCLYKLGCRPSSIIFYLINKGNFNDVQPELAI